MALSNISTPYDTFTDAAGRIISSGKVYIGVAGQDPETNPISVYWDAAGTIPATQPLQVVNGYIVNTGTPAQVYANSDYSIRLYSLNTVVYYFANILAKSITGTAGGDLSGTYPNPSIAAVAVTTSKIADNAVTNAKIAAGADSTVKLSTGGNVTDANAATLTAVVNPFVGALVGTDGVKGLVPAPVMADYNKTKTLLPSGIWDFLKLTEQKLTVSSDGNGSWITLGNFMVCWGYLVGIATDATSVQTFPNSGFSVRPNVAMVPVYPFNSSSIAQPQFDNISSITTTNMTIRNKNIQSSPVIDVMWFAIGSK
jgi:hypothetical protein